MRGGRRQVWLAEGVKETASETLAKGHDLGEGGGRKQQEEGEEEMGQKRREEREEKEKEEKVHRRKEGEGGEIQMLSHFPFIPPTQVRTTLQYVHTCFRFSGELACWSCVLKFILICISTALRSCT